MQTIKYVFQPHGDERGQLVALEEMKDIPFRIKRVYYIELSQPVRLYASFHGETTPFSIVSAG